MKVKTGSMRSPFFHSPGGINEITPTIDDLLFLYGHRL